MGFQIPGRGGESIAHRVAIAVVEQEFTHSHLKKASGEDSLSYPSKSKRLHQHSLLHTEEVKRTKQRKKTP